MKRIIFAVVVLAILGIVISGALKMHRQKVVNSLLNQVFNPAAHQGTVLSNLQTMGAPAVPVEMQALSQTGEVGDAAELALLNNQSATNILPEAVRLLDDKNPKVRLRAAGLISAQVANGIRLSDSTFVPALARALNDTNEYVREDVALALSELGPAAQLAEPALVKALDDDSEKVRIVVARALVKIDATQDTAAIPVFKDAIANGNGRDRHWAAVYLHELQPKNLEIIPVFVGSLTNEDEGVRISAAYSLMQYGSDAKIAVPALQKALNDSDSTVQDAAHGALQRIDPEALVKTNVQTKAATP